jgi:hypothetical protein
LTFDILPQGTKTVNRFTEGHGCGRIDPVKTPQPKQPIGIVQSLSSGFDLVARHPQLMMLPILLDVFLWLGPHLSAYPVFRALINLVQTAGIAAMDATTSQQTEALQKLLDQIGQAFNLFSWLSPTLLGVPSLMAGALELKIPLGTPTVWSVSSSLVYFMLFLAFTLIGLALSALYFGMVAGQVRQQPLRPSRVVALWWGLFKITCLCILIVLFVGFPTLLVALMGAMVNLLVAQFVMLMGLSALLWALFYLAFTVHGVALRDISMLRSVQASVYLMRTQFPPTMGLLIVAILINIGLGFLWNVPPSDSWVKAAGILGHAFVATGLVTATALYYVDRIPAPNPPTT